MMYRKHPSKPHITGLDHYKELYEESVKQPEKFFGNLARDLLSWDRDFETVRSGGFEHGDVAWFLEGRLNASYNCVDRHAAKNPGKVSEIIITNCGVKIWNFYELIWVMDAQRLLI
jgi:acetyl-CoA synthetase